MSRVETALQRRHGKYTVKATSFSQQFNNMYGSRLLTSSPAVTAAHTASVAYSRVLSMKEGETRFCVGTVFVKSAAAVSFLQEYSREQVRLEAGDTEGGDDGDGDGGFGEEGAIDETKAEADLFVLEDESGRVDMAGAVVTDASLVTGVVVGVEGTLNAKGTLDVTRIIYASAKAVPRPLAAAGAAPCYIAFISGLGVTAADGEASRALTLALDYISGMGFSDAGDGGDARLISRVIVGGNLVEPTDDSRLKHKIRLEPADHAKPKANAATAVRAMSHVDHVLSQLAATIPVDVMPGEDDPTNCFYPQQPFHPLMLPAATRHPDVRLVTNPFECTATAATGAAATFCVTAGQNVADVCAQTALSPLAALERLLAWGHLCPTAPNTLACYPFKDGEPFVMPDAPHCLVACNQPAYATGVSAAGVRMVAVPRFSETGKVVLVDVNSPTLHTVAITFDGNSTD
jgi:DNA polymerase delta subunit 2